MRISALMPFLRPCELGPAVSAVMRSSATRSQDIAVLSERLAAAGEPGLLHAHLPQAHGGQRQMLLLGLASGADHDAAVPMVTEAVQIAQRIGDEESSLPALAALAACSTAEERPSLLDRCLRAYRNWGEGTDSAAVLEVLVPQLSAEDQKSVPISAVARWDLTRDDRADSPLRATVVRLMARHGLAGTALKTVTAMRQPTPAWRRRWRPSCLRCQPDFSGEALEIARTMPVGDKAELRAKLLAAVAVRLEPPAREAVLTEALDAAKDATTLGSLANANPRRFRN